MLKIGDIVNIVNYDGEFVDGPYEITGIIEEVAEILHLETEDLGYVPLNCLALADDFDEEDFLTDVKDEDIISIEVEQLYSEGSIIEVQDEKGYWVIVGCQLTTFMSHIRNEQTAQISYRIQKAGSEEEKMVNQENVILVADEDDAEWFFIEHIEEIERELNMQDVNTLLDSYNTAKFLYETTKDEGYLQLAEEAIEQLKLLNGGKE
jgi:hypothetical protein